MFLAIDIGNTNIVLGVKRDAKPNEMPNLDISFSSCFRLGTAIDRTLDEYRALIFSFFQQEGLDPLKVSGIGICCVVPPLEKVFVDLCRNLFKKEAMCVGPGVKTGMPILYDNPKEVGADRIANAVAAYHRFKKSCIIVDFGTATTFDFVTADGEYAGGLIAPGLGISAKALFQNTSKLPRVDILKPEHVLGRNTVGSIQSGLYYGSLGAIDRIVEEILREVNLPKTKVKVIATGGLAGLLFGESKVIDEMIPNLTLEGLEIAFALNRGRKG